MPPPVAIEDLFARQANLHRPIEQQRGFGYHDLVVERIALATEAAAVRRGDHADMRGGHLEGFRQRAMHVMRRLRTGIDDELPVRIQESHRRVLFDRQMRAALEKEEVVEHVIGRRDRLVDVPELQRHRLVYVPFVAVVVNPRFGECKALFRISECPQRLVLDFDELNRLPRGRFVHGNHRRDGVSDESDLVTTECMLVMTDGKDAVRNRESVASQNQVNAGMHPGL